MNLNARYQNLKKFFTSNYDPNTHWEKWGKETKAVDVYANPHKLEMKMKRVNALLNHLDSIRFESVLDFGCGWGFVSKFVLEKYPINNYVVFDASSERISEAKIHLKDFNVEFHASLIEDFHTEKKFDLVLGTGILHHVRPEKIKPILQHLLKFTKHDFIHDDPPPGFRTDVKIEKTTFNFYHDYTQIWKELGYDVNVIPITGHKTRAIYHVKVN